MTKIKNLEAGQLFIWEGHHYVCVSESIRLDSRSSKEVTKRGISEVTHLGGNDILWIDDIGEERGEYLREDLKDDKVTILTLR